MFDFGIAHISIDPSGWTRVDLTDGTSAFAYRPQPYATAGAWLIGLPYTLN